MIVVSLASCTKKEAPPKQVDESALRGVARTKFDTPTPTQAQLERKKRSEAFVTSLGLPTLATLPVVEDEAKVDARTRDEVVDRFLATEICAIKGEGGDQKLIDRLLADYSATAFLSPKERTFIANPDALNWLIRYQNQAWDDVTTDT